MRGALRLICLALAAIACVTTSALAAPPIQDRVLLPPKAFCWGLEEEDGEKPCVEQDLRCPTGDLNIAALALTNSTVLANLLRTACIENDERKAVVDAMDTRADWPDTMATPAHLTSWFRVTLVAPPDPDHGVSEIPPGTYIFIFKSPGSRLSWSEVHEVKIGAGPLKPKASRNAPAAGLRARVGASPWRAAPGLPPPAPFGPRIALGGWFGSFWLRAGMELDLATTTVVLTENEEENAITVHHGCTPQIDAYLRTEFWPGPLLLAPELLVAVAPDQDDSLLAEVAVTVGTPRSAIALRVGLEENLHDLRHGELPGPTLALVFSSSLWTRTPPTDRSLAGAWR